MFGMMPRACAPFISTLLVLLGAAPGVCAQSPAAPRAARAVRAAPALGETGNGNATLSINGEGVQVHPDGAWLAFLPLPNDSVATQ